MTDTVLPSEMDEMRSFLPQVVHRLEQYYPYVSALVTQDSGMNLSLGSRHETISEKEPQKGIVFTLFNGRYFQEWATDRIETNYLTGKIDEICALSKSSESVEPLFEIDPGEPAVKDFISSVELDPGTILLSEMVDACKDLIREVTGMDPRIVDASVHYNDGKEYKLFVNRNKILSSALTLCSIQVQVVGFHKGRTFSSRIGAGGVAGFEVIRFRRSELEEMISDLNLLFESRPLIPGVYEVVSAPEVSGILAHEAFGHGVETDMMVKKRAKAADFLNKPVASELVSMIDDPSLPGLNGSYFFDDEGQIAEPTVIVDRGILKRGLTDMRSATVLNVPRSANGRRESFRRKAYARMSNTYFAAGSAPFEDMVSGIESGLFLKKSSSGMEDPQGWGIQITIDLAQEIKNGRLTGRVYSPVTMTGYVPELLQSISMTGNVLGFMGAGGMCGKGHKEMVRVTAGGPYLRFQARLG